MFRHLRKGLPWQLGPLPLLLLLLIIGRINISVAAKATSNEVNAVTPSEDYDADDDDTAAPAEQNQPKGPKPFFEKPMQTLYLGSANKTQINCEPKNFDDVKHTILWYKDTSLIVNGKLSVESGYQVDDHMNLIIEPITTDTPGKYICQIVPVKVNQTTIVKSGKEPKSTSNGTGQLNLPMFALIALFSICFIAKNLDV